MSKLIFRADGRWADLTQSLLERLSRGHVVLWSSFSGTHQLFEAQDGTIERTRLGGPGSSHAFDGWPVVVQPPFFATACGCGDSSGYRSTPPLLVATVDAPDDVAGLLAIAMDAARKLAADGYDPAAVPPGHPELPCPALYCPVTTSSVRQRAFDG